MPLWHQLFQALGRFQRRNFTPCAPIRWAALFRSQLPHWPALAAFLVLVTWWTLESGGVAIIETRAFDGSIRSTHVWFAEPDGELWLEAGTPSNPWFLDTQREPLVSFTSEVHSGQFIAKPIDIPNAHDRIRSLLRSKYGLRD